MVTPIALVAVFLLAAVAPQLSASPARADRPQEPAAAVSAQTSAEEELALKYNPILRITEQRQP